MTYAIEPFKSRLQEAFPHVQLEVQPGKMPMLVLVDIAKLPEVMAFLKDDPDCMLDFLDGITAVDRMDYFEVIYNLFSMRHHHSFVLKVLVGREEPVLPSLVSIWRGADFQEREIYDMMGIVFAGHPNLKRILLPDDFPGHPHRKEFALESRPLIPRGPLRRE